MRIHRRMLVAIGAAVTMATTAVSQADFSQVDQFSVGFTELHGIATDGNQWYIGHTFTNRFYNFDLGWNMTGETPVNASINDLRATTYHPQSGHLYVGDNDSGVLYEVTTGGNVISSFTVGTGGEALNAAAVNIVDGTIWTAFFVNGIIRQHDTQGNLLSSFADGPKRWTGLAVDPVAQTVLALDTNDTLHEYDFAGNLIANHSIGGLGGNGQGLYYDPFTANLYTTSQNGWITIFNDPDRDTIPAPGALALLTFGAMAARRRRRTG